MPHERTAAALRSGPVRLDEIHFDALGSSCHLFGIGLAPADLAQGREWVQARHRQLTRFDPESELSRFNAAAGAWCPVSPVLEQLLRESSRAYDLSGGLVHAGVLAAMLAAGYTRSLVHGPTAACLSGAPPPPPLPVMLEVRPGWARLAGGTGIDLGGLAKGWLADRLCERLGDNVLVNLGGDLYARGAGPAGCGWPVRMGGTTVLLKGQGAATSSVRKRRWGDGLHHLIDPRTGSPALTDLAEVSVLADTAADAEVLAKTALLLGSAAAPAFLAAHSSGWRLDPWT